MALGFTALFLPPFDARRVARRGWRSGLVVTYLAFSVLTVDPPGLGRAARRRRAASARVSWPGARAAASQACLRPAYCPCSSALAWRASCSPAALAIGVGLLALAPRAAAAAPASPDALVRCPGAAPRSARLLAVFMLNGIASAVPATLVLFFVHDRLQARERGGAVSRRYFARPQCRCRCGCASCAASAWRAPGWPAWASRWRRSPGRSALGAGDSCRLLRGVRASGIALGADLALPGALLTGVIQRAGHAGAGRRRLLRLVELRRPS